MKYFLKIKFIVLLLIIIFISGFSYANTFKIASLSPEGSMWMLKMRSGAKEVAIKTNNRIKFKFYPGGVMGSDKSVMRKIKIGQLHGAGVIGGSLSKYFPDNQVYGLPMKFRSFEEVDYVRNKMDTIMTKGLEDGGFITFGFACGGFAYIMSKNSIKTVDDFYKQKLWIPDTNKLILNATKSFGLSPIPLSISDVRSSLQTGTIDTIAISPVGAIVLQWHTQVKYLTDLPISYLYATLALSKKAFLKIPDNDKKIIKDIMVKTFIDIGKQNRNDNKSGLEVLKKQGIKFIKPDQVSIKEWEKKSKDVEDSLIKDGYISKSIVDLLNKHLSDFRFKN